MTEESAPREKAEHEALLKSARKWWSRWTEAKRPNRSFWIAKQVSAALRKRWEATRYSVEADRQKGAEQAHFYLFSREPVQFRGFFCRLYLSHKFL
jgi:hypothetical protein